MIVLANVGTPLIWFGILHLLVLNLVIGIGEGLWIAAAAKVRRRWAVAWMIVANYASAWAGAVGLPWLLWLCSDLTYTQPPLYILEWLLLGIVLFALIVTVTLELPFVLIAARGSGRRPWWKVRTAVVVQVMSYSILVVLYLMVSSLTVLTRHTRTRNLASFVPDLEGWVYYLDRPGTSVWRSTLRGERIERVTGIEERDNPQFEPELWLRSGPDGTIDLMLSSGSTSIPLVSGLVGVVGRTSENSSPDRPQSRWPIDFRPPDNRPFSYIAGFWAEEGLRRTKQSAESWKSTNSTAFATALWRWHVGYPTILPTGHVVFEMGNQVLIMDELNRIGVIAMGQCPVVVMNSCTTDPR